MLGNLVHFTLNHHDVFLGSGHHQVQIGPLVVLETGVNHELAVDAGYADLTHGTAERQVAGSQGGRSGQAGKRIRLDVLLGRRDKESSVAISNKGDGNLEPIYMWITPDESRTVVSFSAAIAVGKVEGRLVKATGTRTPVKTVK